jgi:hypothetical protein
MTQSGRCLRSLIRSQEAMRRLFRIKRDIAGNVSPFPAIRLIGSWSVENNAGYAPLLASGSKPQAGLSEGIAGTREHLKELLR